MPLILGLFLIALLLVAGSVAAGDAFVQQDQLQDLCDGAAVAAASAADLNERAQNGVGGSFLTLGAVQSAVSDYLDRDPARTGVTMQATLSADATAVVVTCSQIRTIAFGSLFGFGNGVVHTATSTAKGRLND